MIAGLSLITSASGFADLTKALTTTTLTDVLCHETVTRLRRKLHSADTLDVYAVLGVRGTIDTIMVVFYKKYLNGKGLLPALC